MVKTYDHNLRPVELTLHSIGIFIQLGTKETIIIFCQRKRKTAFLIHHERACRSGWFVRTIATRAAAIITVVTLFLP